MTPLEYYDRTQTTDDGFTVHCGWYKVKGKKTTGYTDGEVRQDSMLVYWKTNTGFPRGKVALYGCGDDFSDSFRALSEGKVVPIGFRQRIEEL